MRVRLFHDAPDVLLVVLNERQNRHHGDAGVDIVIGQRFHRSETLRDERCARLQLFGQFIVGGRDGETDRRVDPVDLAQRVQILQNQVALGHHVNGKMELGDDRQRPPGKVQPFLQGHVWIVH